MANFGGFGIDGGGLARGWAMGSGIVGDYKFNKYSESGEMAKDIDAAMKGFVSGDGAGLIKLQSKLSQWGKNVNEILAPHLAMQKQMRDQQEQGRVMGERNAIVNEITPRPEFEQTTRLPAPNVAQFGIGPRVEAQMSEMDELSGIEPNTQTEYRSGSPGRALNQSDVFRLARPEAFSDPNHMTGLMRVPGQMAADEASTAERLENASLRQTQGNIERLKLQELEGMGSADGEPTNRQLALNPSLANRVPQREKADDPLLDDRRRELQSRIGLNNAQANRANRAPAGGGTGGGTALRREFLSMGGDPEDEEAYFDFVQRRSSAGRNPRQTPAGDPIEARAAIAQIVEDPQFQRADEATKDAMLQAAAREFGLKVVGQPRGGPKRSILGLSLGGGAEQSSYSLAPLKSTEAQPQRPQAAPPAAQGQRRAVRVKDKRTGKTGTYHLDPGEKLPANFEAIR